MKFIVPQFIEREAKIIGPLTFKQFLYVGAAGLACFIIYFSFSFDIFLMSCFFLGGIAVAFAFLNIDGIPLSKFIWNFFKYSLSPKVYLWKKGGLGGKDIEKKINIKEEETEEINLSVGGKSSLKNMKTKIETKTQ